MCVDVLLLAFAILAQPQTRLDAPGALRLATAATRLERRYNLPRALLVATVLAESGGLNLVSRHRHGCDVGIAQIYVPRCEPGRVAELRPKAANLEEGARQLDASRRKCSRHPRWRVCAIAPWTLYNSGNARRWWGRVSRIWRRLRGYEPSGSLPTS